MIMSQIKLAARHCAIVATLFMFTGLSSFAFAEERPVQSWSILRYKMQRKNSLWAGYAQLQHRYSFSEEVLFEEQLNISARYLSSWAELGAIGSIVTESGYERVKENRLAFEGTKKLAKRAFFDVSLRFRQEIRFFTDVDKAIYRFRVRPHVKFNLASNDIDWISLSGELNVYLNEFEESGAGFSSFRTILGAGKRIDSSSLSLSYVNDYREFIEFVEVRHVLLLGLRYSD